MPESLTVRPHTVWRAGPGGLGEQRYALMRVHDDVQLDPNACMGQLLFWLRGDAALGGRRGDPALHESGGSGRATGAALGLAPRRPDGGPPGSHFGSCAARTVRRRRGQRRSPTRRGAGATPTGTAATAAWRPEAESDAPRGGPRPGPVGAAGRLRLEPVRYYS